MAVDEVKKLLKIHDLLIHSDQNFLVVEDEEGILDLISSYIRELGFDGQIFKAQDLNNAKRYLNKFKVDYILCDKSLPDGNGDALLKAVRKSPKFYSIPVLMITGFNDIDNILLSSRLGSSDYLTKPFRLEDFELKLYNGLKNHYAPKVEKIYEYKVKIIELEDQVERLEQELKEIKEF